MDIDIDGVPLPADISPLSIGPATSPFAGTWIGRWDGALKTILVVESIKPDGKASVVYAVADNPRAGFKAAWFRFDAEIVGDKLTTLDERFTLSFEVSQTGRLKAVFADGLSFAILARHKLSTLTNTDSSIPWSHGSSELLETELIEDGNPVKLEAVIFKPIGEGPFPLAVINHGSTGNGDNEAFFSETWTNPWLAEVLNENGWIVAFPQRRGRGRSDGLYDEGFSVDRSEGYTCETKRSLAGADRALDDIHAAINTLRQRKDVNAEPIIIVGQSRGGILSIAYAGLHPKDVKSVINFVGGWMGDGCEAAAEINQHLFTKGANYPSGTLWLYGNDDVFYSMEHSQNNFSAFQKAGGKGRFLDVTVGGRDNGHWVMLVPPLWKDAVMDYLGLID